MAEKQKSRWRSCLFQTGVVLISISSFCFVIYASVVFVNGWRRCSPQMRAALQATGYQIVFTTDRNGVDELYVMDADGSNQRLVTSEDAIVATPTSMTLLNFYEDRIPSPDGQYLAFMAHDPTAPRHNERAIWVSSADETESYRITNTTTYISGYSWSPDSQQIAYPGSGWLFVTNVANVDGTNTRQLTDRWSWNVRIPEWSPDGRYLVFASVRDIENFDIDIEIITVNVETAEKCILTSGYEYADTEPSWLDEQE